MKVKVALVPTRRDRLCLLLLRVMMIFIVDSVMKYLRCDKTLDTLHLTVLSVLQVELDVFGDVFHGSIR